MILRNPKVIYGIIIFICKIQFSFCDYVELQRNELYSNRLNKNRYYEIITMLSELLEPSPKMNTLKKGSIEWRNEAEYRLRQIYKICKSLHIHLFQTNLNKINKNLEDCFLGELL